MVMSYKKLFDILKDDLQKVGAAALGALLLFLAFVLWLKSRYPGHGMLD